MTTRQSRIDDSGLENSYNETESSSIINSEDEEDQELAAEAAQIRLQFRREKFREISEIIRAEFPRLCVQPFLIAFSAAAGLSAGYAFWDFFSGIFSRKKN